MEAGQATWNEYKEVVRVSRNETRKSRGHLEFNLAKDNKENKDNKELFLKHINSKRKSKDNVGPLLNGGEGPGN